MGTRRRRLPDRGLDRPAIQQPYGNCRTAAAAGRCPASARAAAIIVLCRVIRVIMMATARTPETQDSGPKDLPCAGLAPGPGAPAAGPAPGRQRLGCSPGCTGPESGSAAPSRNKRLGPGGCPARAAVSRPEVAHGTPFMRSLPKSARLQRLCKFPCSPRDRLPPQAGKV